MGMSTESNTRRQNEAAKVPPCALSVSNSTSSALLRIWSLRPHMRSNRSSPDRRTPTGLTQARTAHDRAATELQQSCNRATETPWGQPGVKGELRQAGQQGEPEVDVLVPVHKLDDAGTGSHARAATVAGPLRAAHAQARAASAKAGTHTVVAEARATIASRLPKLQSKGLEDRACGAGAHLRRSELVTRSSAELGPACVPGRRSCPADPPDPCTRTIGRKEQGTLGNAGGNEGRGRLIYLGAACPEEPQ